MNTIDIIILILVITAVGLIVFFSVRKRRRLKKLGLPACNCSNCSSSSFCENKK